MALVSWPSLAMRGYTGNLNLAATPRRATILRKPAVVNGAPRSETKTNGDTGDSRSEPSQRPQFYTGERWTEDVPFLARLTCTFPLAPAKWWLRYVQT